MEQIFPSAWQGGKITAHPIEYTKKKFYRGSCMMKKKTFQKIFYWRDFSSKEKAYQACEAWIRHIFADNDAILNQYRFIEKDKVEVQLNYKGTKQYAIIDVNDLSIMEKYVWHASKGPRNTSFYMRTLARKQDTNRHNLFFHSLLYPEYSQIDHIGKYCSQSIINSINRWQWTK